MPLLLVFLSLCGHFYLQSHVSLIFHNITEECEDVVVALGEDIEIICKMTNVINGDVRAMYGNLVGAVSIITKEI